MVLWGVFGLCGLTQMTGGKAAILAFTMPVWATLSDSLLSRKMPSHTILLALLLGTIGILLLWLGDSETKVLSIWGPLMVILGGASWRFGTSFIKRCKFPVSTLVVTGWMQIIGPIPIITVALIWDCRNIVSSGWEQFFSMAYNGLISGSLIYWTNLLVVERLSVPVATNSTLAVSFIAVIIDSVMHKSFPHWNEILALLFVALSVLIALPKRITEKRL